MDGQRYPALPANLAAQLADVEQTDGLYWPCMVTLHDGSVLDRVYLAEAQPWFRLWGAWPDDDRGKQSLDMRGVASIADSPSRLPAALAEKVYAFGESGMGYVIFTVRFRDGTHMAVANGNAVDFVSYPPGQSRDTVVDVLPDVGRHDPGLQQGPDYQWCLFEGQAT